MRFLLCAPIATHLRSPVGPSYPAAAPKRTPPWPLAEPSRPPAAINCRFALELECLHDANKSLPGQIESNYDETVDSFDDMSLKSELLRGTLPRLPGCGRIVPHPYTSAS